MEKKVNNNQKSGKKSAEKINSANNNSGRNTLFLYQNQKDNQQKNNQSDKSETPKLHNICIHIREFWKIYVYFILPILSSIILFVQYKDKWCNKGHLIGQVIYVGTSTMEVDSITIILEGTTNNSDEIHRRITTNKYKLKLPAGGVTLI